MVNGSRRVSGRKIVLWLVVGMLIVGAFVVDRLIYFRKISWWSATVKGVGSVYFGCKQPIEVKKAITGDWLIQYCNDKVPEDFTRRAKEITVFPGGCFYKVVIAWSPEMHYWAEGWMPLSPRPGRFVLFDDRGTRFVPADEFASFGCP